MKSEEKLLVELGNIRDNYLLEAETYRKKNHHGIRKGILLAAAVVAVMATSVTAIAANATWRETIRGWFGIEKQQVEGYQEYEEEQTDCVRLGDMEIRQVSELVSGAQVIAYYEITPEQGSTLDSTCQWEVQILDEQIWVDAIEGVKAEMVSQTPEDGLLKVQIRFTDASEVCTLPLRFFTHPQGDTWQEADAVFSDKTELVPVEAPVLKAELNLPLENETAGSTGNLAAIQVSNGNLEIIVQQEYFESWCSRVCVPDSGKAFMEAYTGEEWIPGTPEFDGDTTPYFTVEDEQAIAKAFGDTWEKTLAPVLESMQITMKDGTVLQIQGEPVKYYSIAYSDPEARLDADVYNYTLLPLIELDQVDSIMVMGQSVNFEKVNP